MASANDGTAKMPLTVNVSHRMLSELKERAAADGITPEEMATNLFIAAFRTPNLKLPFPSFTMPDDFAEAFIKDGFRVLARKDGCHTLAPYDGVPFEDAVASFQAMGWSEPEILEKAYS